MKGHRSPMGYRLPVLLVAAFIAVTLSSVRSSAQSNSQVRIVRLSFVEGTVTLYRPDVDEWAKAFVNTPIQQGFKIATDANSFAEVEFENGSTARLGQSSELDFTNLSLSPEGGKINHLSLARGYATFAVMPERGDVYEIHAGRATYSPTAQTMFRVDLDQASQRLEVFKGEVGVQSPYGKGTVAKNQVVELVPGNANPFHVTEGITEDAWDRWVSKRQHVQTVASSKSGPGGSGLPAGSSLYGWNDLSYFGAWNYLPGYGSCWSPTMGAGWSPYSVGRWSWYPGLGYTWISGLPWGWLPFHYGNWIYPAGTGWCWLPGNFSYWSPGLVTWYQGSSWVGWAPRAYPHGPNQSARCPSGQNCSTVVSLNTFQSGRPISSNDILGVHAIGGRSVASPTAPVTRNLRLPGPALTDSPFASANEATGSSGVRARRLGVAPTRIFARGAVSGAGEVQPHAPAVFDRQTHRFVNRSGPAFEAIPGNEGSRMRRMHGAVRTPNSSGVAPNRSVMRIPSARPGNSLRGQPAINNDMLLRSRMEMGRAASRPGVGPRQLTPIPISNLGIRGGAIHHSGSLMPHAQPSRSESGMRTPQEPRMPVFRQQRFPRRNRSMQNERLRRQMEMNRRANMPQQRVERGPAARRSSGGVGGGRSMGQSHPSMGGGMRGNMGGEMHSNMGGGVQRGMGGGMHGGGTAGSRGPHR